MKCPMGYNANGFSFQTCIEKECAWWCPNEKCCAVIKLTDTAFMLSDLANCVNECGHFEVLSR